MTLWIHGSKLYLVLCAINFLMNSCDFFLLRKGKIIVMLNMCVLKFWMDLSIPMSWAGKEGDNRGWDGWMASPTRWAWVWINPKSWWWTGRPGVLQFMGLQRVWHDWATELNWTELMFFWIKNLIFFFTGSQYLIIYIFGIPGLKYNFL